MSAQLLQRADAVTNELMNAVAFAPDDCVVQSPPGAGKTRLLEDTAALAALELARSVMVACPTNDQANDVTARLAEAYPQLSVDRFMASGAEDPPSLARFANVAVVHESARLRAPVVVATVAKYAEVESIGGVRDVALFDEAYQVKYADYLRVADLARKRVAIGDPGQIDPITRTSLRQFASNPLGPHVPAPKAMLAAGTARRFQLPVSRRLPSDSASIVQPAFYPTLPFEGLAAPGQRHLVAGLAGMTRTDQLLDAALAAGSLSMVTLPSETRPRVDPEVIALVADLVDRFIARQFIATDDEGEVPVGPEHIGVVAFHRDQVAALRAALGSRYSAVHVETANRFQGLERKAVISLHPLSGKQRLEGFSTEAGRMCVAISRHRINCIIVGRSGIQDVLDRFAPDDGRFLGQAEDPFFDGWRAHSVLAATLAERGALIAA